MAQTFATYASWRTSSLRMHHGAHLRRLSIMRTSPPRTHHNAYLRRVIIAYHYSFQYPTDAISHTRGTREQCLGPATCAYDFQAHT